MSLLVGKGEVCGTMQLGTRGPPNPSFDFGCLMGKMPFSQAKRFKFAFLFSFGELPFLFPVLGTKSNPPAHFPSGIFVLKLFIY